MPNNVEDTKAITIEETTVPSWFLGMFLFLIWPLWVAVAAPTPTPAWMQVTALAGVIIPIVSVGIGLVFVLRRHVQSRSHQSSLRNFRHLRPDEVGPVRTWFDAAPWASLGFRRLGVHSVEVGEYNGQPCEHVGVILRQGNHHIPAFVVAVRTQPAPAWAAARRRRSRWIPCFSRRRFKVGPQRFRRVWDAYGDPDMAELWLTDEVCEQLESSFPGRGQLWFWSDDRLAVMLWGRPTAFGSDMALHAVTQIAKQAGVLPQ